MVFVRVVAILQLIARLRFSVCTGVKVKIYLLTTLQEFKKIATVLGWFCANTVINQ